MVLGLAGALVYGAAVEKLRNRVALDTVSSAVFASAVKRNSSADDEPFTQQAGLFERSFKRALKDVAAKDSAARTTEDYERVWVALRVARLRTKRRVELVNDDDVIVDDDPSSLTATRLIARGVVGT